MYKLLTEEQKIKIEGEYKLRRFVVMLILMSGSLLIGIVGLTPSYIVSSSKEKDANDRLAALKLSLQGIDAQGIESALQDINTKIKLFGSAVDTDRPYEAYKEIIQLKPAGIELTELEFIKEEGNTKYRLGGTARDRRTLIEFQNNLNKSSLFQNVNVPISDLAKNQDIAFSLTLDPEK